MIIMGDININYRACSNSKLLNLVQLFDLTHLVSEPTRVTESSTTLIDHIYTSNPENISECFVASYSLSDHYPVFSQERLIAKFQKNEHITTTYRSLKTINKPQLLQDLDADMEPFKDLMSDSDINEDCTAWYSAIKRLLDHHHSVGAEVYSD